MQGKCLTHVEMSHVRVGSQNRLALVCATVHARAHACIR